jgi:hypothetical protein
MPQKINNKHIPIIEKIYRTAKLIATKIIPRFSRRSFLIFLATLFVLSCFSIVGYSQLKEYEKNLPAPIISKELPSITNQDIEIQSESEFFAVENNGETYYSTTQKPFLIKPKRKEGYREFSLYSKQNFGGININSMNYTKLSIDTDYTAPTISKLDLKPFYTEKINSFSFAVEEKSIILKNQDLIVFDHKKVENTCSLSSENILTCPIDFGEDLEKVLNYTLQDEAGNSIDIIDKTKIIRTNKPEISCNFPSYTNLKNIKVDCNSNKEGKFFDGDIVINTEATKSVFDWVLTEGENVKKIKFKDNFGLETEANLKTLLDTISPTLEFTSLPQAQKFQQGNFVYGLKANENVTVEIQMDAYNDFIENSPRVNKGVNFGYYGSVSKKINLDVNSNSSVTFGNKFASCQLLDLESSSPDTIYVSKEEYQRITKDFNTSSQWFNEHPGKTLAQKQPLNPNNQPIVNGKICNLYNGLFAVTKIKLTDSVGNVNNYYCTNFIYTDKDVLTKDGTSICSNDPQKVRCSLFASHFRRL